MPAAPKGHGHGEGEPASAKSLLTVFGIGAVVFVLVGLYALLYVLLNLEAYSLLIGSVLMFFALAGVMYMTRSIDWSGLGKKDEALPVL